MRYIVDVPEGGATVVHETLVQCTVKTCGNWRRTHDDVNALEALHSDNAWTCAAGTNSAYASCEAAQELSNDRTDERITIAATRDAAVTKGATVVDAASAVSESRKASRGERKSPPSPSSPETAQQDPGVKARPAKRSQFNPYVKGVIAPAKTTGTMVRRREK
jgi:hypothetical protein